MKDLLQKGSQAIKNANFKDKVTHAAGAVHSIATSKKWGEIYDQTKRILNTIDEFMMKEKERLRFSFSSNRSQLSQFKINSRSFKDAVWDFYWRVRSLHLIDTIKIVINRYVDSRRASESQMLPNYDNGVDKSNSSISRQEKNDSLARSVFEFAAIVRHSTKTAFANWQNPENQVFVYDSEYRLRRTDLNLFGKPNNKKFDEFVTKYFARNFVFGTDAPNDKPLSLYWRFTLACGLVVFVYTYLKYYFKGKNDYQHMQEFIRLQELFASQLKQM